MGVSVFRRVQEGHHGEPAITRERKHFSKIHESDCKPSTCLACSYLNSLGPIADISAIISTVCFRRHNLCKKCQNLTKFSHIEEYKKTIKKPVNFRRGASVASMCIFTIFYENKMAASLFFYILWLEDATETHFCTFAIA